MSALKWILAALGALAALAGIGALYQLISEARDKSKNPPPGKLVDVGGHRLHIHSMGEGGPTVVMDAGGASSPISWSLVQPEVAKFTRVITFDRAGHGWSDPGPKPQSSERIIEELDTLLSNEKIEGPYIMVGQSFGGQNVRLYASRYPDKVAGMVLVDSAHEDWAKIKSIAPWRGRLAEDARMLKSQLSPILARLGWLRLRQKPSGLPQGFPKEVQAAATALDLRSRAHDWLIGISALIEMCDNQLRNSPPLPDIPLTVLSAHVRFEPWGIAADEADRYWLGLAADLASRVPNSTHIVSEKGGHNLHYDDPKLVIDAIRQVVETVRAKH
jgi:pimeloyl-ACP methyl ester carboxylesterase